MTGKDCIQNSTTVHLSTALITLLLFFSTQETFAESENNETVLAATPAAVLSSTDKSLLNKLKCPTKSDDFSKIIVFCKIRIKKDGRPRKTFCFTVNKKGRNYVKEAKHAIASSGYSPATVNGNAVEVMVNHRIVFLNKENRCDFAYIPNWGTNESSFGIQYIAPQEIMSGDNQRNRRNWQQTAANSSGLSKSSLILRDGVLLTITAEISSDGIPKSVMIARNYFATKDEERSSLQSLKRARFIPGRFNGQPTQMRFFDMLYISNPFVNYNLGIYPRL